MKRSAFYDAEIRRQEKQRSREVDAVVLKRAPHRAPEIRAYNSFFSVLDRSMARIVSRRVRVGNG